MADDQSRDRRDCGGVEEVTTIAFDGTTLAVDCCSWANGQRRKVNKLFKIPEGTFAGCGDGAFVSAFVRWKNGERSAPLWSDYDVEKGWSLGVLITPDKRIQVLTNLFEVLDFDEKVFAMGGGAEYAWGALEAGATATRAVEIAAKRSDFAGFGVASMLV